MKNSESTKRIASAAGKQSEDDRESAFLAALGDQIRGYRAKRGMTRKMLSKHSGVSERYIAQMELGKGNVSVLLLRNVAAALGIELSDLLIDHSNYTPETVLMVQLIRSLSPEENKKLYRLVSTEYGAAASKNGRIALIGLRGAGKTTLGQKLATDFDVPFIRLAVEIEKIAGMSVNGIFSYSGQQAYRRFEREALESIIQKYANAVIEAGGSLVSEPSTFNLLLKSCFTVWVSTSPREHMDRVIKQGDLRPMADNKQSMMDLERILSERSGFYNQADIRVDTSNKTIAQSYKEIRNAVKPAFERRSQTATHEKEKVDIAAVFEQ